MDMAKFTEKDKSWAEFLTVDVDVQVCEVRKVVIRFGQLKRV
jgi:hypothetical protein